MGASSPLLPETPHTQSTTEKAAIPPEGQTTSSAPPGSKRSDFYSFFRILSGGIATPAQIAEYIENFKPVLFIDRFGRHWSVPGDDPRCSREAVWANLVGLSGLYYQLWIFDLPDRSPSGDLVPEEDTFFEREVYGIPADHMETLIALQGGTPSVGTAIPQELRSDHRIWSIAGALLKYVLMNNTALNTVNFDALDESNNRGLGKVIRTLKKKTDLNTDGETVAKHLKRAVEIYKKEHRPSTQGSADGVRR